MTIMFDSRVLSINLNIYKDHDYYLPESKDYLTPEGDKATPLDASVSVGSTGSAFIQRSLMRTTSIDEGIFYQIIVCSNFLHILHTYLSLVFIPDTTLWCCTMTWARSLILY